MSEEYFIIYDIASGEERFRGWGPTGIAGLQRPPEGGRALKLSKEAWTGDLHEATEEVRKTLWEQAKAIRQQRSEEGVQTPYGRVDTDEHSVVIFDSLRSRALAAKVLDEVDYEAGISLANNGYKKLNADQVIEVANAVTDHIDRVHAVGRAYREKINAATSVTALLKIDLDKDW